MQNRYLLTEQYSKKNCGKKKHIIILTPKLKELLRDISKRILDQ